MLHRNESRIKAIIYDFAPSNTVKILDMINNLPFVENLGTVYSQDSIEEKIIEKQKLSPGITLHLFRICQEALNNILKHANANIQIG